MKIGYARVSTKEQKLELQIEALKKYGCEKIYFEKISSNKQRPEYDKMMEFIRAGDELVIYKLDRISRSVKHLIKITEDLKQREIAFISLKDKIDTTTATGRFFFNVMASISQLERELISERTKDGLEQAKKRGRVGGRPRAMSDSQIENAKKLLKDGVPAKVIAEDLNINIKTFYSYIPASSLYT